MTRGELTLEVIVRQRNQSEQFRYRETAHVLAALCALARPASILGGIDPNTDTMFSAVQLNRRLLDEIDAIAPTTDTGREARNRLDDAARKAARMYGYLWICPAGSRAAGPGDPRDPSGSRFPGRQTDWYFS